MLEAMVCAFRDKFTKDMAASSWLFFWNVHSGESQLLYIVDP